MTGIRNSEELGESLDRFDELKEAGRLWLEDIDSLNHGLGSFRTERKATKDLKAVFRRILVMPVPNHETNPPTELMAALRRWLSARDTWGRPDYKPADYDEVQALKELEAAARKALLPAALEASR